MQVRHMKTMRPAIGAALMALAFGAGAQPAAMAKADTDFAKKAAMGGIAEVEAGKVAQDKATNADVKAFASQMVTDHTAANDELKQIASGKNIGLPAAPDPAAAAAMKKMQGMSAAAFDRAYVTQQVTDHKKTVALFEAESKNGKDADLKGFATKTLPTIKQHLQMVQSLQGSMSGAASAPMH